MPMPSTAIQRRADVPPHSGSREPARRIASQGRPYADRPAAGPVALASAQASAVIVDMAVLQERARIARELHDSVAQTLYAIGLVAGRALTLPEVRGAEHIERAFDQVLQLASDAQAEVRTLLGTVWADEPQEVSFSEGLKALAANQERYHGLQVRVAVASEHESVPPDTAQLLLAIAREALSNVVRHAGATHVDVAFETSAVNFTLVIADDGRGFDPAVARPGHFGIRSMRERARALGAHVQVTSAAGAGTRLQVCVPRKRSA